MVYTFLLFFLVGGFFTLGLDEGGGLLRDYSADIMFSVALSVSLSSLVDVHFTFGMRCLAVGRPG